MNKAALRAVARDPVQRARSLAACPPAHRAQLEAALAAVDDGGAGRRHGRLAQASGQSLETWLDAQHDAARVMGLADMEHTHPAVLIRDGVPVKLLGRSGPDYRGVLKGGTGIAVEAKVAGKGRLPLVDDGSMRFDGLKRHQRRALELCVKLGGVALLVVRFVRQQNKRPEATDYAVPFDAVAALDSLGPDDCADWRIRGDLYLQPWVSR